MLRFYPFVKIGLILIVLLLVVRFVPLPKGVSTPDWYFVTRANDIVRQYGSIFSHCKIISDDHTNGKILKIYYKATPSTINKPNEINAIFDCFLFLTGRNGGDKFSAISCEYKRGVIYEIDYDTIEISKDYFEEIRILAESKTSQKDLALKLSYAWQEATHYNRKFLLFAENDHYKENLISNWRYSVACPSDAKYYLFYSRMNADRISINKANNGLQQGVAELFISPTKYTYAAWGENKDVWIYGDFGLLLYEHHPNDIWISSNQMQDKEVPFSLQKVINSKP